MFIAMKKTKINLLSGKDEYLKIQKSLQIFHSAIVLYTFLFVAAVLVFVFIQYRQNQNIQDLIDQKRSLLLSLSNSKDQEAKLVFVAKKVKAYNQFLLDDAHFLPYYNLLISALKTSSESLGGTSSATLNAFSIDKDRTSTFTLSFSSVAEMLDSFRYIESTTFLKNFEQLSLSGLNLGANFSDNTLSFKGKFIKLANETTN
jgi:hypothetical protein